MLKSQEMWGVMEEGEASCRENKDTEGEEEKDSYDGNGNEEKDEGQEL